jgi:hypothetical protein
MLTVVFACSGGWFLYRSARVEPGVADRISLLLHTVMCAAMIAMVWSWGARIPHWPQVAVLGSIALWFLVLAVRAQRMTRALREAHHALMAAVMVWMAGAPMPVHAGASVPAGHGAMAGMAGMTGPSPAAVVLAAYSLLTALVWLAEAGTATGPEPYLRRMSKAAGHAAMSAGTGVLVLTMS